jgi:hypothetical protein
VSDIVHTLGEQCLHIDRCGQALLLVVDTLNNKVKLNPLAWF